MICSCVLYRAGNFTLSRSKASYITLKGGLQLEKHLFWFLREERVQCEHPSTQLEGEPLSARLAHLNKCLH